MNPLWLFQIIQASVPSRGSSRGIPTFWRSRRASSLVAAVIVLLALSV